MSKAANQQCVETTVAKPSLIADIYACSECAKVFPSWQQMRLHEFKIHGVKRDARRFIGELNSCPACLRRHDTRTQAVRHLYNSKKCGMYEWYCDEVPDEDVQRLDKAETLRLQKVAKTSAFVCCQARSLPTLVGPLREIFVQCYKGRPRCKEFTCTCMELPCTCSGMNNSEFADGT